MGYFFYGLFGELTLKMLIKKNKSDSGCNRHVEKLTKY